MPTTSRNIFLRIKMISLLALFLLVITVPETSFAASPRPSISKMPASSLRAITGNYQYLGDARGQGDVLNSIVGPGKSASGQLFYLSYIYDKGTMDFVAIDPNTGNYHTYPSPAKSEEGAWGLAVGPDYNMYIGTLPNAHLLKFDTASQQLIDLGQIPPDPASSTAQSYIWQLTVSPYNKFIYGCTYPSADLISYDPLGAHPRIINLGSMDPTDRDLYARACVADPHPGSPYVYLGLGTVSDQIAVYNIHTHTIISRLNGENAGPGWVYPGSDGNVHSWILNGATYQYYVLSNGEYAQSGYAQPAPNNVLRDGGAITVSARSIAISSPGKPQATYPYTYRGENLSIFRLGLGSNGIVYGGTVLPYDFLAFNPGKPSDGIMMQGQLGGGEPYSMLAYNQLLYIAAYSAPNLEIYDPSKPFDITKNPLNIPSGNFQPSLRPLAMIGAPGNHLFIGAIAPYGRLTGPLIVWNTRNNSDIQEYFPVQNQGVASLTTTAGRCQNSAGSYCIIGATTIFGGGGTIPATSSARIFSWDPVNHAVLRQYSIPNVSNATSITDLLTNPANGYIYGIANNRTGSYIFVFNPHSGTFINGGTKLPFSGEIYNSAVIYQGKIWGVSSRGIFNINLVNVSQATLIPSPRSITAGFVMSRNVIYFASKSSLWSYTIL